MTQPRYICTGPPGAGKTTVLNLLSTEFSVVPEPARRVLAAEKASGGRGTGDQDPALFVARMLDMALKDAALSRQMKPPVLFDRAVPDLLAFAAYYDLANSDILRAAQASDYGRTVFWFPAWEMIYTTDDERTMDFAAAKAFGERIAEGYVDLGYRLIEVPRLPVGVRADFIRAHIS